MKVTPLLLLCSLVFMSLKSVAADIDAAIGFAKVTENRVYRDRVAPNWLQEGKSFWYRVKTGPKTSEYVWIDSTTGARKTSSNLSDLSGFTDKPVRTSQTTLKLSNSKNGGSEASLKLINQMDVDVDVFWITTSGQHQRFGSVRAGSDREQSTYAGHVWLITSRTGNHVAVFEAKPGLQTYIIDGKGITPAKDEAVEDNRDNNRNRSPDKKWTVEVTHNAILLNGKALKLDGGKDFVGPVEWSPDSRCFAISRCAPVEQRRITIVDSTPSDQVQPKLKVLDYTKPGDPLPKPDLYIVKTDGTFHRVPSDLFPNPFTQSRRVNFTWAPDSSEGYFDYNQRGHQLYRIIAVNPANGSTRTVVEETSKTFIDYTQKTWRHWMHQTGELLWMSERDGWCHLWLYDIKSGKPKVQITKGSWVIRNILHVDEARREIWFMASGIRPEEDPYHQHLCRVKMDGSAFVRLTDGDGNHKVDFSPDRQVFVDTWSRADKAPASELRRSSDGSLVTKLEDAGINDLLATGWSLPERFVAKARDGKTDIHGIIIKPSRFDPAKRYPVVEDIYAGPHDSFAPKDFDRLVRMHEIAELGFIVVKLDGMGTDNRGKVFHDVCWKNIKDAGFPDRKLWIKEAAKTRPWMDLSRIGIYGGSAGGQNAMRALLDHHDFYKVAVADCGCHDNRMDKIWWNEQWMGWPVDDSYVKSSNKEDAAKLQGHLLLIVGELDTNVDPASTMQVVAALQKAGKTFDFMPIAGAGHGAAETPYGSRLRMEFLVRHLRP